MSLVAQLDRTVLEKMEKSQLLTVCTELDLKSSARLKKADIIDQILAASTSTIKASEAPGANPSVRPKVESGNGAEHSGSSAESVGKGAELSSTSGRVQSGSSAKATPDSSTPVRSKSTHEVAGLFPPITVTPRQRSTNSPQSADSVGGATSALDVRGDGGSAQPRPATVEVRAGGEGVDGEVVGSDVRRTEGGDQLSRRARRRRGRDRSGDRSEGSPSESQAPVELQELTGILDLREEGFGFIRAVGYLPSARDVYVAASLARKYGLRKGDVVTAAARQANSNEKYPAAVRIERVADMDPEIARMRPKFEDLTPLFPDEKLVLETVGDPMNMVARIVDLIAPIGKGQRGLIVAPPKAGKTTIVKQIAHSIEANNPEVHLMVLLVDERPEEVTDIRRSVRGEVIASTFDRPADEHTVVAELTIERAKRMVEQGKDVVIILDGITRLARAYNLAQPATGRIMSGGVDSGALYPPKKFFGAARNVEEGGSLTVLATALVETGSKMDEVIFEEYKGTGNMELRLDRRLAERRLFPAIDVNASSTRHEELLFSRESLNSIWKLRRVLNALASEGSGAPGLELLIDKVRSTRSNQEFLAEIQKSPIG